MPQPNTSQPDRDGLRAVLLADFAAMRSEITTFLSLQGQFLSISVVLLGVLAGLLTNASVGQTINRYGSLAAIPFLILGLLYADVTARIMRTARYIEHNLRPELVNLAGESLLWERYIRNDAPWRPLMSTLDCLRWFAFLGPGAFFTFHWFGSAEPPLGWVPGLDLALLILCVVVLGSVSWQLSKTVVKKQEDQEKAKAK
jgi:hypothetical protein